MRTTTVIAKDTSSAMDDIITKLGDDAVILSTKHKDGKVHMTATTENVSTTPKRLKPSQQFSKIFESRMLNDQILNQDKPLELEEAYNDKGASTAQLSALRSEIQELKYMLSGVVVTEPQNLNDNVASSSALRFRQSGFSPKVVKRLEKSFLGKDFENGRVSFLRSLAKTLVPDDIENFKEKQIFYIIGPSGSGKTTLGRALVDKLDDVFHIDGDDLRGLSANIDYSEQGRISNIRTAQSIAMYLDNKGQNVVVSVVAPYKWLREEFKERHKVNEIYLHTTEIRGREHYFAADYEAPSSNFLDLDTTNISVDECIEKITKEFM